VRDSRHENSEWQKSNTHSTHLSSAAKSRLTTVTAPCAGVGKEITQRPFLCIRTVHVAIYQMSRPHSAEHGFADPLCAVNDIGLDMEPVILALPVPNRTLGRVLDVKSMR
jgi:hypothetical protein